MSAISSRFLHWAADHENAYVAQYFAWVVFAWLLFLAGLGAAIYAVWCHIPGSVPTAGHDHPDFTFRRGIDTYVATQISYVIGGKRIIRFIWTRLPRPGEIKH